MINDEQTNPDQTGTWEPDVHKLIDVWFKRLDSEDWPGDMKDVITEYRRQQAAAGVVEVRRVDLAIELGVEGAHNTMEYDDVLARLHAVLAADREQQT